MTWFQPDPHRRRQFGALTKLPSTPWPGWNQRNQERPARTNHDASAQILSMYYKKDVHYYCTHHLSTRRNTVTRKVFLPKGKSLLLLKPNATVPRT